MGRRRATGFGIAVVAVVLLTACTGGAPSEEETAARASPSPVTDEEAFDRLLEEYQRVDDAAWAIDPDDAYALELAEHGADLSECGFRRVSPTQSCPKPKALNGDLRKNVNVVLILDASGSMQGSVGGRSKISIAKQVLVEFIGTLPKSANVALRVYGHVGSNSRADKKRSCAGSESVLPLQPLNKRKFRAAIRSFDARGWTPLGRSLKAARRDFAGTNPNTSSNFVYVVSDGIETCGGNPVEQARRLNRSNIRVQVNIVGFDVNNKAARQLRRAARSGGGKYFGATNADDLDRIFRDNYNWTKWTAYYNCKWEQKYREFNTTWNNAYKAYNCVWDAAYAEYNAIWADAYAQYNSVWDNAYAEYNTIWAEVHGDDRYDKQRDAIIALAQERRDLIIEKARQVRDYIIGQARDRRDALITATRQRRDTIIAAAATQRDTAIDRAAELRDQHIGG
jgi:hypothetical protein